MKKVYLSALGLFALAAASAQLSVGAHANYTMYKGSLQKSAPGGGVRFGYSFTPKSTALLGFTMAAPITEPSSVTLMDDNGNSKTAASEFRYKFKTIHLLAQYAFVGDEETRGKFYGMAGAGYVIASYNEQMTEDYDKSVYQPIDLVDKGSENGFTLNFGLGGEYGVGAEGTGPRIFSEAALALPANQQNGSYVENNIPSHFMFNLGVKFTIGGGNY